MAHDHTPTIITTKRDYIDALLVRDLGLGELTLRGLKMPVRGRFRR